MRQNTIQALNPKPHELTTLTTSPLRMQPREALDKQFSMLRCLTHPGQGHAVKRVPLQRLNAIITLHPVTMISLWRAITPPLQQTRALSKTSMHYARPLRYKGNRDTNKPIS